MQEDTLRDKAKFILIFEMLHILTANFLVYKCEVERRKLITVRADGDGACCQFCLRSETNQSEGCNFAHAIWLLICPLITVDCVAWICLYKMCSTSCVPFSG